MPKPDVGEYRRPEPHVFIVLILLLLFFMWVTFLLESWAQYLVWVMFLLTGLAVVRYTHGHIPRYGYMIVAVTAVLLGIMAVLEYILF